MVNDASDDGRVEMTVGRYSEVTVIGMTENLGYCIACNLAMLSALGDRRDWVIWANNDIQLEARCLNELGCVAPNESNISVLGAAFAVCESDDPNYYMVGNHPNAITAMRFQSRDPIDVESVERFRLLPPLLFKPFIP
jgi:GT2 family glycosyltransferase